ncbi:MAG TPA: GNAT family N-acetyltransferase [Bryobacteraceae bacterium]|nr:GNAT family N-acetyltransferase [Bryobacteraceae bacterium]
MDYRAVDGNLQESFRILARHGRSGELRDYDGTRIASAGVTFQMFNAAFLSSPVEDELDLRRRIAQCVVHFSARGLDWAFWVCEDWVRAGLRRRLRQIFRDHHMQLAVELPGMISERLPEPDRRLPRLEMRRVTGGSERNDFCAVGSVCFGVPLPWFCEVFANNAVWGEFASWVGYADGVPVSTAATVVGAGAIGLYNIATLPGYQRRGYGEAVMRHAVTEACREHGVERTILQSTSQGLRLYERLGYRKVTGVAVYAS